MRFDLMNIEDVQDRCSADEGRCEYCNGPLPDCPCSAHDCLEEAVCYCGKCEKEIVDIAKLLPLVRELVVYMDLRVLPSLDEEWDDTGAGKAFYALKEALEVEGKCCACGYAGEEETSCEVREDGLHCECWYDGTVSVFDTETGIVEPLTAEALEDDNACSVD
jgi:hypothetical protein